MFVFVRVGNTIRHDRSRTLVYCPVHTIIRPVSFAATAKAWSFRPPWQLESMVSQSTNCGVLSGTVVPDGAHVHCGSVAKRMCYTMSVDGPFSDVVKPQGASTIWWMTIIFSALPQKITDRTRRLIGSWIRILSLTLIFSALLPKKDIGTVTKSSALISFMFAKKLRDVSGPTHFQMNRKWRN